MPCLIALFALIGPRVALIFTWLASGMIGRAIDSVFVAILGILLLPWTTLAYVVFYDVGTGREVHGFEWFLVGLAFLADIGSYVGGRMSRSERPDSTAVPRLSARRGWRRGAVPRSRGCDRRAQTFVKVS